MPRAHAFGIKLEPEGPALALSKADLGSPGGLCLLGTSLSCQAAHPSFHLILVMVFGAEQVPSVPCCSVAGRGPGWGVHGRREEVPEGALHTEQSNWMKCQQMRRIGEREHVLMKNSF